MKTDEVKTQNPVFLFFTCATVACLSLFFFLAVGVWGERAKRRNFFEKFAKANGFDPLVPENWYSHAGSAIRKVKGGNAVLSCHGGSLSNALTDLFPTIAFDKAKFQGVWGEAADKKKEFLENYARQKGFDPLVADNWYLQPPEDLQHVTAPYGSSLARALLDVFPDIEMDRKNPVKSGPWTAAINRRKFFEKFAEEHGFDPLVAKNWYPVTLEMILPRKGSSTVLSYHGGTLKKSLLELFPDIGLEKAKFNAYGRWVNPSNRREFFDNYAKENGFDALFPENWYSQSPRMIRQAGGAPVMSYHGGSVARTLLDLFPNIGLKQSSFKLFSWAEDSGDVKQFFESYAKENGFDPLVAENWHSLPKEIIQRNIGMNFSKPLVAAFPDIGLDSSKLA